MDNRPLLEKLTKSFNRNDLTLFFQAGGKFKPEKEDYSHFLERESFAKDLVKLGKIDFDDGRRLVLLAGEVNKELITHSGKLKQYEIAKKVLKDGYVDAGIFVFHDDAGHFRFSLITAQYGAKKEYSSFRRYTYFISSELPARTFIEQIGKENAFASIESITNAFNVEPVTKEFFTKYEEIFKEAENTITFKWSAEQKRLYTQRFFNRLMFLAFLERKGWLNFSGNKNYLRALRDDYDKNETDKRANFHRSRLNNLFFQGLSSPWGDQRNNPEFQETNRRIGNVPYLNGGLFDKEADDETWFFPDSITAKILNELMYRYNFTVTESTPLDVEVAVDPEMLGRIFEELVTGRHESGSYYTVKPVVAFMCYEALASYLGSRLPAESEAALTQFVYQKDPSQLRNPEAVLEALRAVKVCDPACGSGAYLLGMLHVLLELRECLFATRSLDAKTVYERKLEIIQNNLYGVDKDDFAVNIARLRLWLSLIVDYEGAKPPPLPNLDFKIETGDSLTAPDPSGGLQPDMFRQQQVKEFLQLKNEFMNLRAGSDEKKKLAKQIDELKEKIKEWAHVGRIANPTYSNAFDWQVDFAEVFAPELAQSTLGGKMAGIVNTAGGQMELTDAPKEGGFDIVLANPPYIRYQLIPNKYKKDLEKIYKDIYDSAADLYIYFYGRANQLLRPGGVACFISSNKWLRAGYGERLCQYLLDKQVFPLVVDFGELPVFQAVATFPAIFLWKKEPRKLTSTLWAVVKDLQECYDEGIREYVSRIGLSLPSSQFGKNKPRLVSPNMADIRAKMESNGQPLGEIVGGTLFNGIKTGINEAFIIDRNTYEELVMKDRKNSEILKPLLMGDDVRHFEVHYRERYLVQTYIGVDIKRYPKILEYLRAWKKRAEIRNARGNEWWELRPSNYYGYFPKPKIIYPDIGKECRFVLDEKGYFTDYTVFNLPISDYYILGVLNSSQVWEYLKLVCSVLGDEEQGGRLRFYKQFMEKLPIPNASPVDRNTIAKLAEEAQKLHTQRRVRVEKFLREIGIEPAQSTSRNPLEKPWSLTAEEFTRRVGQDGMKAYKSAHEETMFVTDDIVKVESEIDERVKALYGL